MTAPETRLVNLINTLIVLRLDLGAFDCRVIQDVLSDIHTELSALHRELPQEYRGRTEILLRKAARLRFEALFSPLEEELKEFFEEAAELLQDLRETGALPSDGASSAKETHGQTQISPSG